MCCIEFQQAPNSLIKMEETHSKRSPIGDISHNQLSINSKKIVNIVGGETENDKGN